MNILTLHTGLFEDAEIIIKAAEAPVVDVRDKLSDAEWDNIVDQILDVDMIITA